MNALTLLIQALLAKLNIAVKNLTTTHGLTIYKTALSLLGMDASPADLAPDELGCAETVSDIIIKAGFPMPVILSTKALFDYFSASAEWLEVPAPLPGDVIISPTGYGGKNGITNGHTGIVGTGGTVMSNHSATGTFEQNYTLTTWGARYAVLGGYPVYYFRKI